MNAIEKLRKCASGEWGMVEVETNDALELLREIDGLREACARICDERAKVHIEATRAYEAESCAAAIRAGGKP